MNPIQRIDGNILEAKQRLERIIRIRKMDSMLAFEMAQELYIVQEYKEYQLLDYDTFEAYLGQPEVDISQRTASRLIRIHKKYIIEKCERYCLEAPEPNRLDAIKEKDPDYYEALIDVGVSKLDMAAGYVTQDNDYKLLNTASTLSRSDLQAELTGIEPNYTESWRSTLIEARTLLERLEKSNAPLEVREYANEFLRQTNVYLADKPPSTIE